MLSYYLFILVVYWISPPTNGWETPSPHQYHIQTDEGPERYFRYQTDSGQYRKEKRLEDGTVVGTYAWIDADGIMHQRDYIADSAGYRILKSKKVYVGRHTDVGEAIKVAKKYPASAGTLVQSNKRPVITVPYSAGVPPSTYAPSLPSSHYVSSSTPASVVTTTSTSHVNISPHSILSTTPHGVVSSTETPVMEITPSQYLPPSSTPAPSLEPPVNFTFVSGNYLPSSQNPFSVATEYISTSNPTRQYVPPVVTSTEHPYYPPVVPITPPQQYIPTSYNNLPQPLGEVDNSLDYNPNVRQVNNDYRFQNGPTYPIDRNGKPYSGQNLGNGYDPQYPTYDGVSVTNDGFRYYIPRAYHEEQTLPGEKRSGSFGYIDPFGIRRVIYYNTAPGSGFQHRKNNRYVGFQATPYDPRPY
ncbi:uncharacterized protein [Leptinotarsa decemlineata]|uniref:uncharacterized protein n=1 Tax=Leptinotarsa decemlineata TaxID=7539 RepID=UPI003D304AB8